MQKQTTPARRLTLALAICAAGLALSPPASAQVTAAAGYVPPDDKPALKVGFTLFADYTYTDSPTAKNADGSDYNPNAFNVSRAYINITGQLHHLVSFRITPDITRETGAGSSLNGSYTFRLKYGFGQFNLDDWLPKGSWVRLGLQQTPVHRLRRGHLPIPVPERDHRRPRRLHDVVRPRALQPRQLPGQLRRRPRRHLQRRGVQQGRGERPEGLPGPRLGSPARGHRRREGLACDRLLEFRPRREGPEEEPMARRHDVRAPVRESRLHVHRGDEPASPRAAEVKPKDFSIWVTPRTTFGLEAAHPLRRAEAEQGPRPEAEAHDRGCRLLVRASGTASSRPSWRTTPGRSSTPSRLPGRTTSSTPFTRSSTSDRRRPVLRPASGDERNMKTTFKEILPVLFGSFAVLAVTAGGGTEGPDQRRGRDVPLPDLLEVVRRVPQAAPRRGDQLPVDRLGRRHSPAHERDRLLRRFRRADDERPARRGSGRHPSLPDGPRRCRADPTTSRASRRV